MFHENDITRALAALMYFKLHQQIIGSAKQFKAVAHYSVNQKRLSEVIHGKKYLRKKQKHKGKGTEDDPEILHKEEELEEEGEEEEEITKEGDIEDRKRKRIDDDNKDDDFTQAPKKFSTKYLSDTKWLSRGKGKPKSSAH